jgi:hypothetical protein
MLHPAGATSPAAFPKVQVSSIIIKKISGP